MALQLAAIAGPQVGKTYVLHPGPDLMLGRGQAALYQFTDPTVSRAHCQLILDGDQVTVINNSSNGTFVNAKRIKQYCMKLGDILSVGETQLRLEMGDSRFDLEASLHPGAVPPATTVFQAPATPEVEELCELTGQMLSRYAIGPMVGQGRSSVVFLAKDTDSNQAVALKVLLPDFSKDEEEVQRFIRAMKTMMPLRHPNLVTLLGAGKTGPHCWIAMEYVAGESMTQVIKRIGIAGMLDWRFGFKVALHVGRALAYAHGQQIIHRNVTPGNILLQTTEKTIKLGDLMLAKALEGNMAQQVSRAGDLLADDLLNELPYLAPERTRASTAVDPRSDLYALGATVYALLTGRPPFLGNSIPEIIARIRQTEPEKPKKFQVAIPDSFEQVVMKLLAKEPNDRYQTAPALITELERLGKSERMVLS